jgi:integrase
MLTDAKLRAAKPRAKPYKLTDSHRLYVLVTPSGGKHWRWNYSFLGKQKSMAFGSYPLTGLIEARQKRDDARRLLNEGKDPAIIKKLALKAVRDSFANTFEKIARQWHETYKPTWAVRHANDVIRSLERDIFPHLGPLPITLITPPKILETLRAIEDRSAIETAKRIRQRISAVYAYAIGEGIADSDPAEKIAAALKPLRRGRQPAITELPALRKMLQEAEEDYARPITRMALRFLALTVVRPGELRTARWEDFEDLDGKRPLWRIPAWMMKGDIDRKEEIGGDHLVPLAHQSVELLRVLWRFTGNGKLLFPNMRRVDIPMSENAIGYLLNRAGYHGRHVPHGFRAAFSTIMNEWAEREGESGDRQIIDLMLAHVPKEKVESAYNRAAYMPRRRELAQIWADKLVSGLPLPVVLADRPAKPSATDHSRRMRSPWLREAIREVVVTGTS